MQGNGLETPSELHIYEMDRITNENEPLLYEEIPNPSYGSAEVYNFLVMVLIILNSPLHKRERFHEALINFTLLNVDVPK